MKETIRTRSVGRNFVDVQEDFILAEEPMSRLVFHAQMHQKGIRGKIIRQRRESKADTWIPEKAIDIRNLGKNETINFDLKTEAVSKLYSAIKKLGSILESHGVEYGSHEYAVVDPQSVIITNNNKAEYINKILDAGYGNDIWQQLVESNPSLVTKMAYVRIITDRQEKLKKFIINLDSNQAEEFWQDFFQNNEWIFGYGLNYQFLHLITSQPRYVGANYTGKGEQKGDYLMHSGAECKFTVLVEIKKPTTDLVLNGKYRNGAWKLGPELLWAVSQLQINCNTWFIEGSRSDKARDDLEGNQIFTYQPKGILVIGHTNQLDSREKRQSFESFRKNLHNPEILTFDELYERASYILSHSENEIEVND